MEMKAPLAYGLVGAVGLLSGLAVSKLGTNPVRSHSDIISRMQVQDGVDPPLKSMCVLAGWEDAPDEPHAPSSTWIYYRKGEGYSNVSVAIVAIWGSGEVNPCNVEVGKVSGNGVAFYYDGQLKMYIPPGSLQFYVTV